MPFDRQSVADPPTDASVEAFAILDQIIAARTKRSTTVIDTGSDPVRRADYRRLARRRAFCGARDRNTAAGLCRIPTGNATAGPGAGPQRTARKISSCGSAEDEAGPGRHYRSGGRRQSGGARP
jgi:hypothetical protein